MCSMRHTHRMTDRMNRMPMTRMPYDYDLYLNHIISCICVMQLGWMTKGITCPCTSHSQVDLLFRTVFLTWLHSCTFPKPRPSSITKAHNIKSSSCHHHHILSLTSGHRFILCHTARVAMVRQRVRNKDAGLKRPPSAYALYCSMVSRTGVPYPPIRKVIGKLPVRDQRVALEKWRQPQNTCWVWVFQASWTIL